MIGRRISAGVIALLSMLLVGVALAYACSPQADLGLEFDSGQAGDRTTVRGTQWTLEPGGTVEVRWGTGTGPLLGKVDPTADGSFSLPITIPEVAGGVYYIVAYGYQPDDEGTAAGKSSVAYTVTVPERSPATAPSGSGSPDAAPSIAPATAAPPTAAPGSGPAAAPSSGGARQPSSAREPSRGDSARSPQGDRDPASSSPGRRGAPTSSRGPAGTRIPGSNPPASGPKSVFPGSMPSTDARERSRSASTPSGSTSTPYGKVSGSASASKLWSGLTEKKGAGGQASRPAAVPSLGDPALPNQQPARSPLVIGMALLGLGLVAMFGGFTIALVRRRRAPVEAVERSWSFTEG